MAASVFWIMTDGRRSLEISQVIRKRYSEAPPGECRCSAEGCVCRTTLRRPKSGDCGQNSFRLVIAFFLPCFDTFRTRSWSSPPSLRGKIQTHHFHRSVFPTDSIGDVAIPFARTISSRIWLCQVLLPLGVDAEYQLIELVQAPVV